MAYRSVSRAIKVGLACLPLALVSTPAQAATFISSVVATGLNAPRDVVFGPDVALYIAEAGFNDPSRPGTTPPYSFLNNGSITRLYNGTQTRIVRRLPSIYNSAMNDISGPQGIGFDAAGTGYVLAGLGADPAVRPAGSGLGHVLTFTAGGAVADFADVSAFEAANNPVGGPVDSNPFHLTAGSGGLFVTDAGANALYSLAPDGTVSLVAALPRRFIGPPVPSSDFVPTGVTVGPDGTTYIAQLTGFPFTPGAAQIYAIAPGSSTVNVFATGFTNLTDIEFGADGNLYALSYDLDSLLGPGVGGGIFQVSSTGAVRNVFSTGLANPTGFTIDSRGDFYVTAYGTVMEGTGQLIKVEAVPEPATWGMMLLGFGAIGSVARRRRTNATVRYA